MRSSGAKGTYVTLVVVDVMLADRELRPPSSTARDLHVDVSTFAVVCRRSLSSNGLVTACRSGRGRAPGSEP
jgi:hypothetical protein